LLRQDYEVEVLPCEGSANPGNRGKSDRSADASGARSRTSFFLPEKEHFENRLVTAGTKDAQ